MRISPIQTHVRFSSTPAAKPPLPVSDDVKEQLKEIAQQYGRVEDVLNGEFISMRASRIDEVQGLADIIRGLPTPADQAQFLKQYDDAVLRQIKQVLAEREQNPPQWF